MKPDPDHEIFEDETRRVARALWPAAQHDGALMVDGRERDGVFETEDCFHLLEATTSKRKDKAVKDIGKMVSMAKSLQKQTQWKAVKCWFVTQDEPTAEQRTVANSHKGLVNAISYSQFQSKLIDARTYLTLRDSYPFGSVRDPESGDISPAVDYIPIDLVESRTNDLWSPKALCDSLIDGGKFVILGDYGAGKSMTLRKIYQELRKQYFRNQLTIFPVFINLRDHYGQTNASEILERHARLIGFPNPSHIVRAWRAGYVTLLIDGIDEITTVGIQGLWKRLQDTRYRATQGIRELVRDNPCKRGIALAGRAHFFDSEKEREKALGLNTQYHQVSLNEFNDEQIRKYLERSGLVGHIPSWLPTRPLLIGYLASRKVLEDVVNIPVSDDSNILASNPGDGWNHLINKVCEREAGIEAGIDGETVRKILERLSTIARAAQDGLGPLNPEQVIDAFKQICGYSPDEKGMLLLQRLPGLGIDRPEEETRKFVDEGFVDVCRAGDLVSFISYPYDFDVSIFENAECGIGELGATVAADVMLRKPISEANVNASLEYSVTHSAPEILKSDIAKVFQEAGWSITNNTTIKGVFLNGMRLDEDSPDLSRLEYRDCYFSSLRLEGELNDEDLPKFRSCYVGEVVGRASIEDTPMGLFDGDCEIDNFSGSEKTTKALINTELPLGTRVLQTVLKKIYQQAGSGRKEKALVSGLDHHARRLVPTVMKVLQSEQLAIPYKRGGLFLWLPNRNYSSRAARIISAPSESDDPAIIKCREIE